MSTGDVRVAPARLAGAVEGSRRRPPRRRRYDGNGAEAPVWPAGAAALGSRASAARRPPSGGWPASTCFGLGARSELCDVVEAFAARLVKAARRDDAAGARSLLRRAEPSWVPR